MDNRATKGTLLILGASVLEIDVVKRAQALGYKVIVTDNHEDTSISPAKLIADEAWNLSWRDFDMLEAECKNKGVNGVLAGFSEIRVESQILLCQRLNLRCDTTLQQLELTRDKLKFKALCSEYGIPVARQYSEEEAVDHLPVIIKPADRGGSAGIRVVWDKDEYAQSLKYAKEASFNDQVVIEEFLGHQTKFDAYYLINNGNVTLIATDDTLMVPPVKGHEICQGAWLFPSVHKEGWIKKVEPRIVDMLHGIGLKNGYITISAFVDKKGNFSVFETGLRLSGDLSYKYSSAAYNYNYLDFIILRAMGEDVVPDFPHAESKIYMLTLNFFAKNGTIVKKLLPSGDFIDILAGEVHISSSESRLPLAGMLYNYDSDKTTLVNRAIEESSEYKLIDGDGNDLVSYRFSKEQLNDFVSGREGACPDKSSPIIGADRLS